MECSLPCARSVNLSPLAAKFTFRSHYLFKASLQLARNHDSVLVTLSCEVGLTQAVSRLPARGIDSDEASTYPGKPSVAEEINGAGGNQDQLDYDK